VIEVQARPQQHQMLPQIVPHAIYQQIDHLPPHAIAIPMQNYSASPQYPA
jgi:hypothetical protein